MRLHRARAPLAELTAALCLSAFAAISSAEATAITDPVNDFLLGTYTGRQIPALDVVSAFATFDGTVFHIGATVAGPIDTSPTGGLLYVWGVNRGAGANNFASIGLPGVVFDSVITLTGAGVLGGVASGASGSTASISGSTFQINVPLTALPALNGFTPLQYGFNLWPRDALVTPSGTAQISDFAPNATTFTADLAVPEPVSLTLLATGLLGLGLARRRRP